MRGSLVIAGLALLAACASAPPEQTHLIDFDRPPPADWPDLQIDVYSVSPQDMAQACPDEHARMASLSRLLVGCSSVLFCERRCTIWLLHLPEQLRSRVLDHEQAHCLGYDHPGSSLMRNAWARAKASGCGR